ncbi:MAG: hypothetical protein H6581_00605 [Bacteroidia bacterium]|nr:hypothetical protein [Bacteroidia bacterium]
MNIPFDRTRFLKYFLGVLAFTALLFLVAVFGFDYEMTTADPFCAPIAAALLAYFLHLMFWPGDE